MDINNEKLEIWDVLKSPLDYITSGEGVTVHSIQVLFKEIAKLLFGGYNIVVIDCNGKKHLYKFAEVEFYYYKRGLLEEDIYRCTYPRTCEAGKFLWHDSGVDICFESNADIDNYFFGGILIRSLIDENNDIIGGPGRCANELSFLCKSGITPTLCCKEKEDVIPLEDIRQGIDCDVYANGDAKIKLCFYVDDIPVEKWKKRRKTVLRMTKEGYKRTKITYYYNDYPSQDGARTSKLLEKKKKKVQQKVKEF